MSTNIAPVLPWAVVPTEEKAAAEEQNPAEEDEEEDEPVAISLQDAGLEIGQRIEVKWTVTPEGGEPYNKWWGATVCARDSEDATDDAAGREAADGEPAAEDAEAADGSQALQHVFQLRYDAQEGFEQESCEVAFLGDHWLFDLNSDAELPYRKAGDSWEPSAEDETMHKWVEAAGWQKVGDDVYTSAPRDEATRQRDSERLSRDAKELMADMTPAQQHYMAAGVRDIMDAMRSFMEAKAEANPGAVIEAEDVHEMFRSLREKRPRLA